MTLLAYSVATGGSHMSRQRYSPEFKDEAVRQVVDQGHSVAEVADRLGVPSHSLHKWVRAEFPLDSYVNVVTTYQAVIYPRSFS